MFLVNWMVLDVVVIDVGDVTFYTRTGKEITTSVLLLMDECWNLLTKF